MIQFPANRWRAAAALSLLLNAVLAGWLWSWALVPAVRP